jgi:hypothetical protein
MLWSSVKIMPDFLIPGNTAKWFDLETESRQKYSFLNFAKPEHCFDKSSQDIVD